MADGVGALLRQGARRDRRARARPLDVRARRLVLLGRGAAVERCMPMQFRAETADGKFFPAQVVAVADASTVAAAGGHYRRYLAPRAALARRAPAEDELAGLEAPAEPPAAGGAPDEPPGAEAADGETARLDPSAGAE